MNISKDKIEIITRYIKSGAKIQAIKYYCDETGVNLKEGKSYVEELESKLMGIDPSNFNLPPASKEEQKDETVDSKNQLEHIVHSFFPKWHLSKFEKWSMGWVAFFKYNTRIFQIIKDRGYFEIMEMVGGKEVKLPFADVIYQENLTENKVLFKMLEAIEIKNR